MPSGGLLGIQYWFYYVFHDDPGQSPHPHDWWYFWVVYDVGEYKPSKAIFDFHHNLRAFDFNDPRVHRDWLHVRTYHDAGGHRVMYAPGEEIDTRTALKVGRYIEGEEWYWQLINILSPLIGYFVLPPISIADALWNDNTPSTDEIIGLMVKLMWFRGTTGGEGHAEWRAPGWGLDYSFYPPLVLLAKSAWWDPSDDVWKVEEFPHWVWIYEVEVGTSQLHPGYDRVYFTGDNIYNGPDGDLWPIYYSINGKRPSTYLPWRTGVDFAPNHYGEIAISSTEMVWKWKCYQFSKKWENRWIYYYDWTPVSPTIYTRYYDGSGV